MIINEVQVCLDSSPGWFGRTLQPGKVDDRSPLQFGRTTWFTIDEGVGVETIAQVIRGSRAKWLVDILGEVVRTHQIEPLFDDWQDFVKLSVDEQDRLKSEYEARRLTAITDKRQDIANPVTSYSSFGVAIVRDLCAQIEQHGFVAGAVLTNRSCWWDSAYDQAPIDKYDELKQRGFDTRFFCEPAVDDTGIVARMYNRTDGYGYEAIDNRVIVATTIGRTSENTKLGIFETNLKADGSGCITLWEKLCLTDLRCFAFGTSI